MNHVTTLKTPNPFFYMDSAKLFKRGSQKPFQAPLIGFPKKRKYPNDRYFTAHGVRKQKIWQAAKCNLPKNIILKEVVKK